MDPLKDPKEFGRRISAARGWAQMSKVQFAKAMDTSVPTVRRWEAGEKGSIGTAIVMRLQLAERIQAATGCPPEILGIHIPVQQGSGQSVVRQAVPATAKDLADLGEAIEDRLKDPESPTLDDLIQRLRGNDRTPPRVPAEGEDHEHG